MAINNLPARHLLGLGISVLFVFICLFVLFLQVFLQITISMGFKWSMHFYETITCDCVLDFIATNRLASHRSRLCAASFYHRSVVWHYGNMEIVKCTNDWFVAVAHYWTTNWTGICVEYVKKYESPGVISSRIYYFRHLSKVQAKCVKLSNGIRFSRFGP